MRKWSLAMMVAIGAGSASPSLAADAARAPFGKLPDGQNVEAVTLSNRNGMQARIISYGASIQSVLVPDRHEELGDIALGNATIQGYLDHPAFMGATVGRVANRIANGRFTLNGKVYQVPINNGPNALHGGPKGFDKVNWKIVDVKDGASASVTLRYVSPDGEMGFPGTVTVTATYALDENNALSVEYKATTDKTTVVNLSNHAYWNLSGEGSGTAMNHLLTIPADFYSPTDATAIPTGEFKPVQGTVFDFRKPTPIGARVRDASDQQIVFGRGYDHNWVVARDLSREPRLLARVEDPKSGRIMKILSNQPGIQFYSGNFMDATTSGKAGGIYRLGDAIVLEPQMFPDTPNRPEFGSVKLEPGQTYRNIIIWQFSTDAGR
jgi:aldose 1-epimerase